MPKSNRNVSATIKVNLLDQTFGEWTVIGFAGRDFGRRILWLCRCFCGRTKKVLAGNLSHCASTMCSHCSYTKGRARKHAPNLTNTVEFTGSCGVFDLMAEFGLSVDEALEVSDHLPVWAEFSVRESTAVGPVAARPGASLRRQSARP